ncbi:MAG TPA: phenylalanine--tRNA ligase subunit beta [Candidatus Dojkabacteria bacterium]|nr:phenylalanine--tRNA ligase subunit beta [Candidatus Dojkabacteria bacterium]
MKASINLLKKLSGVELDDKEIVKLISEHIGQVEDFHDLRNDYKDIVIAEIIEKQEHPNADKLGVYKISDGKDKLIQVLAGDKTLEIGDKVVYLRPGSKVPYTIYTEVQPVVISKRKMRGIESNGMMGAEKELNIGPDYTHVLRLPKDAPVGESFSKYYELDDTVVDIENKALTNRGDLFGILGLARELSAITNNRFESPKWYTEDNIHYTEETSCLNINITNDAEALCPRYTAISLDNIKIEQSPIWLKSFLIKSGIASVNNIVDITNYLSHLIGQPLHAFDYDKLVKNDPNAKGVANINIRMAKVGEKILALDNKLYELDEDSMVIADSTNPIAIAGIIGGSDTQVDESTKRIVLECANFDKTSIRKTSMRLGISTEAATKFKHAINPYTCIPTLIKAVELIKELSGASLASEIVDIYPLPLDNKSLSFSLDSLNTLLGTKLTRDTVETILSNMEYKVDKKEKEDIKVQIPYWRMDIDIKEDIFEDIGRIYGYNNIPISLPVRDIQPSRANELYNLKRKIREILSNSGANETDTYSFTNIETLKKCNQDPELAFRIKNALAPELSLMRTSLISSLLTKSEENIQRGFNRFVLFEMNIAHQRNLTDGTGLPLESWYLSTVMIDSTNTSDTSAFYLAKRYLNKILDTLHIEDIQYTLVSESSEKDLPSNIKNLVYSFEPNRAALITYKQQILGVIGEFSTLVKNNFKLPVYSAGLEIDLNSLLSIEPETKIYQEVPKYPSSIKDLCVEVDRDIKYIDLENEIRKIVNRGDLWGEVTCIDIYSKDKEDGKKRITFRLNLRNFHKTLDNKDITEIIGKIGKNLKDKFHSGII